MRGHCAQQATKRLLLRIIQASQQMHLGPAESLVQIGQHVPASRRQHDPAAAPVIRVRLALHQTSAYQVIQQVGHNGPIDAEKVRERRLAARLITGRRGQNLVGPVPARQALSHSVRSLDVTAEHYGERPAQVAGDPLRSPGRSGR